MRRRGRTIAIALLLVAGGVVLGGGLSSAFDGSTSTRPAGGSTTRTFSDPCATPSATPFATPTPTPTPFALPTATPTPFALPTATPTPFALPTATPTPTPTPFALPTATPTPTPFALPTATPTPTPTPFALPTATATPTATPTVGPTPNQAANLIGDVAAAATPTIPTIDVICDAATGDESAERRDPDDPGVTGDRLPERQAGDGSVPDGTPTDGAGTSPDTTVAAELPATGGSVPYWSLVWLGIALVIPGVILTVLAGRRLADT